MSDEELQKFCQEREVEVFTHFDVRNYRYVIKMRKGNFYKETSVDIGLFNSPAFRLTIKVILNTMANELDKKINEEVYE